MGRGRARTEPPAWQPATVAWAALLVVAVAVAWSGSLAVPFLLDDPINIAKNPVIQGPLDTVRLLGDARATVTASLRWNFVRGGLDVAGYHRLNVAAHAVATVLVFLAARAVLGAGGGPRRPADARAGVAALLFALHPMQVESVTYVIQRAEVFAAGALAAVIVALSRMERRVTAPAMAGLVAACAFGAWSKPSFVVAPALGLLYDLVFLARGSLAATTRRWPAHAVTAAAALGTLALARSGGAFQAETAGFDMEGITPLSYLATQPGVVVQYLRVVLWPAWACFDCGYRGAWPVHATFLGDSVVVPAAILGVVGVAAVALRRILPVACFGVAAAAVTLLPTSSVVPLADFYVEHRMYLAIAFLAMGAVEAGDLMLARIAGAFSWAPRTRAAAAGAAAALVVAALAAGTAARNRLFADPIRLMQDSVRLAPQGERLRYNLANALKREGRADEAIPHYEAAIAAAPTVARSYQNLGSLYLEKGDAAKARELFAAGVRARPDFAMGHRNLATALLRLGLADEALAAAEESLRLEPGNANGLRLAREARAAGGR